MKYCVITALSLSILSPLAFASGPRSGAQKTPQTAPEEGALESAGAADEEPDESTEAAESGAATDESLSAGDLGITENPLGDAPASSLDPDAENRESLEDIADSYLENSGAATATPAVAEEAKDIKASRKDRVNVVMPENTNMMIHIPPRAQDNPEVRKDASDGPSLAEKLFIMKVQKALTKSGFKVEADGVLGGRTVEALRQFQKKNGLKASGQLEEDTLSRLGLNR